MSLPVIVVNNSKQVSLVKGESHYFCAAENQSDGHIPVVHMPVRIMSRCLSLIFSLVCGCSPKLMILRCLVGVDESPRFTPCLTDT